MTREDFWHRAIIAAIPEAGMQKRSKGVAAIAVAAVEIADAATEAAGFSDTAQDVPARPKRQPMSRKGTK